jgi:hypothetical protein
MEEVYILKTKEVRLIGTATRKRGLIAVGGRGRRMSGCGPLAVERKKDRRRSGMRVKTKAPKIEKGKENDARMK